MNLLFDKHSIFSGFKCSLKVEFCTKIVFKNRLSRYIFAIALFQIRFYILIFVFKGEFLRIYVYLLNTASRVICIHRKFCLNSCI